MWSELSTNAVCQIKLFRPWSTDYELRVLYLYKLANFSDRLLKHRLVHQDFLKEKDVQDIFALGKPFVLDGWDYPLPYPIVPEIVEAFQRLSKEPSFLDITLADEGRSIIHNPTDVWPQVYDSYFPCDPCRTTERIAVKRSGFAFVDCDFSSNALEHAHGWEPPGHRDVTLEFVVEKLHISSKHFDKQLVVQLRFVLEGAGRDVLIRPPTAPDKEKAKLHTVTIRLVDGDCRRFMEAVARKSKTKLLIADFAAEVYGFVDRADLGTSLIANLELYEVIFKLRHKLPVHHLTCECEEILVRATCGPPLPEDYWLRLHHFRRDLAYSDVRRFKIPATSGFRSTAAESALIRRYLSNSYVVDFKARPDDATFVVTMLGALVERNFSLDRLRVCALQGFPPADVRLTDAVLHSGLQLRALKLCIDEHCLHRLIKTSDFFRTPTLQRLKELKLLLVSPTSSTRMPAVQWLKECNLLH